MAAYWDDKPSPLSMSDDLDFLLRHDDRGPKVDTTMINIPLQFGVIDGTSLITFSQQPFVDMFSSLPDSGLEELTKICQKELRDVKVFSQYLFDHDLFHDDGQIDPDSIDPASYLMFWMLN
jgi:hypothetical protein